MDTNIHLKITAQSLMSLGFWPIKFKYKLLNILYNFYFLITVSVFGVFVFSQFIEIYMVIGKSLEELSGVLAINFLYTLGLVKIWVIARPTVRTLVKKIQVTEQNIMKDEDEEVKKIFMEHVEWAYIVNRLMMYLGVMCYFVFMLTPTVEEMIDPPTSHFVIINNDTTVYLPRPLPLVSWFPFDRYKYYYTAFTWHMIGATFNTTYIVSCNNMFFALMIFAVGQIKILQYNLKTITKSTLKIEDTTFDEIVNDNLRKAVIYHQSIIQFVKELDVAMRMFLLLDFAACALQIAMIGFEIVVADLSIQLLKNVIYIGSMVTQLFLFYWHGNEVLLESSAVAAAVWESSWYDCNESAKKTLLQVMVRSQKPLRLSVGVFYYMSTQTMLTILKSSYTYTALMHQLYSRKGIK